MNIVIGGCGKIGEVLCHDLVSEGHQIMVIDSNPRVIERMISRYDLSGLEGSITSLDSQLEAEMPEADLFIACTPSDEANLIAAIIASRLGAGCTMARVRDTEYAAYMDFIRDSLGVSLLFNPELLTAASIEETLRFPAAFNVERFVQGQVMMVEVKLEADSDLTGLDLIAFRERFPSLIITAVSREEEVHIPGGRFVLEAGDRLLVTGKQQDLNRLYQQLGTYTGKLRSALIIGGGRITHYLLSLMEKSRLQFTVIEQNPKVAMELAGSCPEVRVLVGDGTEYATLDELIPEEPDALIALTGVDEENIMISIFGAKNEIPRIFTKVNRTEILDILGDLGLETILTPKRIAADSVIRRVRALSQGQDSSVEALSRLLNNRVEALEFIVSPKSPLIGIPLFQLPLKKDLLIAFIYRQGEVIFPTGQDALEGGDRIVVVSKGLRLDQLEDMLEEER